MGGGSLFYSAQMHSKKDIQVSAGLTGTVMSVHRNGDVDVALPFPAFQVELNVHGHVPKLEVAITKGVAVEMIKPGGVACDSEDNWHIPEGHRGVVTRIDAVGDAVIQWEGKELGDWLFKKKHVYLRTTTPATRGAEVVVKQEIPPCATCSSGDLGFTWANGFALHIGQRGRLVTDDVGVFQYRDFVAIRKVAAADLVTSMFSAAALEKVWLPGDKVIAQSGNVERLAHVDADGAVYTRNHRGSLSLLANKATAAENFRRMEYVGDAGDRVMLTTSVVSPRTCARDATCDVVIPKGSRGLILETKNGEAHVTFDSMTADAMWLKLRDASIVLEQQVFVPGDRVEVAGKLTSARGDLIQPAIGRQGSVWQYDNDHDMNIRFDRTDSQGTQSAWVFEQDFPQIQKVPAGEYYLFVDIFPLAGGGISNSNSISSSESSRKISESSRGGVTADQPALLEVAAQLAAPGPAQTGEAPRGTVRRSDARGLVEVAASGEALAASLAKTVRSEANSSMQFNLYHTELTFCEKAVFSAEEQRALDATYADKRWLSNSIELPKSQIDGKTQVCVTLSYGGAPCTHAGCGQHIFTKTFGTPSAGISNADLSQMRRLMYGTTRMGPHELKAAMNSCKDQWSGDNYFGPGQNCNYMTNVALNCHIGRSMDGHGLGVSAMKFTFDLTPCSCS